MAMLFLVRGCIVRCEKCTTKSHDTAMLEAVAMELRYLKKYKRYRLCGYSGCGSSTV